ncbi:MAG: hypothetical protein ICV77_07650 [Cyanobacteria bacterium Co-bin8]|nr:hypothetical protein [Cyanobacteria bacterium Co-bin8]
MHTLSFEQDLQREIEILRHENSRLQRENYTLKKRLERANRIIGHLQILVRRYS